MFGKGFKKCILAVLTVTLTVLFAAVSFDVSNVSVYAEEADRLPAFPGAEGGGKYTLGARAAEMHEVYHVTNLNDKGSGSLRDAVSRSNRIIVFDVSGVISLDRWIVINQNNLTILGQTAPGDGITIEGGGLHTSFEAGNSLIIRYLKIRPGDRLGIEQDAIDSLYSRDVIIDHCSVSWATDEQLTIYSGSSEDKRYELGKNITVQNCLISEALNLSTHKKGEHGYGSIFGSDNSTLYHNVYAHNVTRNPGVYREINNVNITNNIIYDWGSQVPSYGAQPYSINWLTYTPASVNYVDNFFRYGPTTGSNNRNLFYSVDNDSPDKSKSNYYISGNVIDGNDEVIRNNLLGVRNAERANILTEPLNLGEYEVPDETAYETYDSILETVGAYLPRRDAIDAKVIADIKNGTGHIINSPQEVGGYVGIDSVFRRFEIPEEWRTLNSMGSAEENDIVPSGKYKGYTWIEAYVFDLEESAAKPTNPDVIIQSPAIEANTDTVMGLKVDNGNWKVIDEGQSFNLKAEVIPKDGTSIIKTEVYDKEELIRTIGANENVDVDIFPSGGTHYYTLRAYNNKGEATSSTTATVCVNPKGETPNGYSYIDLGNPPYKGCGRATVDENGVYTVGGSGRIAYKNNCGFMYRAVKGDFSISAKIESVPMYKNRIRTGLLMADGLSYNSSVAMLAHQLEKMGGNMYILTRSGENSAEKLDLMSDSSGNSIGNITEEYDPDKYDYRLPEYIRMERFGNTIRFSVSDDGTDWTNNPRQPYEIVYDSLPETLYIGFGVESNSGAYPKPLYSMAKYSNLKLVEYDKLTEAERWSISAADGSKITVINKLSEGEVTPDGKKINVYAAVYDGEELLKQCAVGAFVTERDKTVYDVELKGELTNSDNIKVFLWDDNMSPVPTE